MPRGGWKRTLIYFGHRLRRIPDSPTRIARGFAFGVFTSFSPFFGFHIILALLLAKIFRGNLIATVAGTAIGNPLTFPFIISGALKLGTFILGRDPAKHDLSQVGLAFREAFHGVWMSIRAVFGFGHSQMGDMKDIFLEVMLPYTVGGAVIGLGFAIVAFYSVKPLIVAYQNIRRKKLAKNARKKQSEG